MAAEAELDRVLSDIRACRLCAARLEPRPVVRVAPRARLLIAGQAPGMRVHKSGVPFDDPSGDRLRAWMGVDRETFYDIDRVNVAAMAFCFPGYDAAGADKPPPPVCAATWRARLLAARADYEPTLPVGRYAQAWYLGARAKPSVTETVRAWRDYTPRYIPLAHPS